MSTSYVKVLRAALNGVSGRKIAQQYRVSRDTVTILLRQAKLQGWQRAEDLEDVTEEDVVALLSGSSDRQGKRDQSYKFPDYEYVHMELGKAHVTLTMLWEEYVEHCILENKKYYRETPVVLSRIFRTFVLLGNVFRTSPGGGSKNAARC